jgi:hypothetical protein
MAPQVAGAARQILVPAKLIVDLESHEVDECRVLNAEC